MQLKMDDIKNVARPELDEWEGDWWTLGVEIVQRKVLPAVRWWGTYCCLSFEESGLNCWIGESFGTSKLSADVHQKLRRLNTGVSLDADLLWVQHPLKAEEAASFDEPLDRLLEQWIRLWKKAGGMKEVFKAQ